MSKYTYHIAFNVSDYTEVFPENRVKLNGFWEGDSWMDRVEVDEIKIHKRGNEATYATIAAWIVDHTKYNTECFFKIQKSGVDWETFIFGIRWGTIDTQTGVYKFKPQAYDSFFRYWGPYIDDDATIDPNHHMRYYAYNNDTNTTLLAEVPSTSVSPFWYYYKFFELYETAITNLTGDLSLKSTILNNDASTVVTVTTTNGLIKDYVTGRDNFFLWGAVSFRDAINKSTTSLLDILKLFNIFPFFESDTVVRLEHNKYLLTQLQNNTVSLTLDADENQIEYLEQSVPFMEKFSMPELTWNTDTDFTKQIIRYATTRTGFTYKTETISFNQFTDISNAIINASDYNSDYEYMIAGAPNQVLHFTETEGGITLSGNSFASAPTLAGSTTYVLTSNDFSYNNFSGAFKYNCNVYLSLTGTYSVLSARLYDRSSGLAVSNSYTLVNGLNTFDLTTIPSGDDAVLKITIRTISAGNVVSGWATVQTELSVLNYFRVANEIGAFSGTKKINGPFSQANILQNWWNIYRPTNEGIINGVSKTFTDSQFIIRRPLKKRYWPDDINMQYGINDGTHIAKIERYTRDLDSDFVEFTLIYQEYE